MRRLGSLLAVLIAFVTALVAFSWPASAADDNLSIFVPGPQKIGHGLSLNFGPSISHLPTTTAATLTITLPTALGATVVSASGDNGAQPYTCAATGNAGEFACDLDPMSGYNTSLNVLVSVDPSTPIGASGDAVFTVTSSQSADPDTSNNTATVPVLITGVSDLKFDIGPKPTTIQNGGVATFTATVLNAGPDDATGTTDRLSISSEPVGAFAFAGSDSPNVTFTNPVPPVGAYGSWTIGTLPVGGTATLSITISASMDSAYGVVEVYATSDNIDPVCENNACLFGAALNAAPAGGAPSPSDSTNPSAPSPTDSTTAPTAPSSSAPTPTPAATQVEDSAQLANTGGSVRAPIWIAVGALLVGAAMLIGTRRRTGAPSRH
jgi:LPXTG-motif cell wall-anchored protein